MSLKLVPPASPRSLRVRSCAFHAFRLVRFVQTKAIQAPGVIAQAATDARKLLWSQVREDCIVFRPSKTAGSSGARVLIPITSAICDVLERARTFGKIRSMYLIHTLDGNPHTMSGIRSA